MTTDPTGVFAARYTVTRELGRGGLATVYLATDLKLERQVALKVLRRELAASLDNDRFLREIEFASRLSHPNILTPHDSGEASGQLYYATPYVDGESLRQKLEREGQLSIDEMIAIVSAVASALTYAHQQGIVHRDIKPENILLTRNRSDGTLNPFVADLGIAHALHAAGGERLTETGLSLGTPAYMSPEQASSDGRLDSRSDIYSLGCVAYEMLAGSPPFIGPTPQAIVARHAVDAVPPLRTVRSTVPQAVEAAIDRALAKKPADRFATAKEFADTLARGPSPTQIIKNNLRTHRPALAVGIGAAVIAGAVVLGIARRSSPAVVPSAASIAVLPFMPTSDDTLLARLGRDLAVTLSTSLQGVGGIQTADRLRVSNETADRQHLSTAEAATIARRVGAESFVKGSIDHSGDKVRLTFGLYHAKDQRPLAEGLTASTPSDSIHTLTDSAAWALLRRVWSRGEPPSPSLAAVTTKSLPALRAFLDGERELNADRWQEAALAFKSALAFDSTFYLAVFRYALTQYWLGDPAEPQVLNLLRRHLNQFPEQERLLAEAFLTDSFDTRMQRYRTVTKRFPAYWPGWFLYADDLHHGGPLVGYDWYDGLEAFHHVVALNSRLVPAWEHLFWHTRSKDRSEATQALTRLTELGWTLQEEQLFRLTEGVYQNDGRIPQRLGPLADSIAELMLTPSTYVMQYGPVGVPLLLEGFPAAQIELNNRVMDRARSHRIGTTLQAANAWAWATRGRWDSTLPLLADVAAKRPGVIGVRRFPVPQFPHLPPIGGPVLPIESYGAAVVAAWMGATAPEMAPPRRPAALAAAELLDDEESKRDARARIAWFDGLLAYTRRDLAGIAAARREASRSGYYQTNMVDRSLAAFDRALTGDQRRAGQELAAAELECAIQDLCNNFTPHIAVQRLAAAQWLTAAGETEQARRLLRYQDANVWNYWGGFPWLLSSALAGPTYLLRARLEELDGQPERAEVYYRQFLQRYDQPMPPQVHLVDEAKGALARLERATR